MVPLSYHFYKKAVSKYFGGVVRVIYQDVASPGDYPGAAELAAQIRDKELPLPVVAIGEEVIASGGLPTVEELLSQVGKRRKIE
ncbi:MAG: hypothetical protein AB1500_02395 [Bacillota bacterium]